MSVKFSNNASTTLASDATNSATSITVADGSVFPSLSGTDYFYVTLETAANTAREIVKCTARSGNTLTITRAQDGTSALAFTSGDKVELRLTAAVLNDISASATDMRLNAFTGDGSTTAYTLSTSPVEANTLVYLDGVYQNKTAYAIVDNTLTFSAAPASGVAIEITAASIAPIQASSEFIVSTFSGDNSTTVFTLASQSTETNTNVYIDGVYQSKSGYSVSGTTLTFSAAPPSGVAIEVMAAHQIVVSTTVPADGAVTTAKLAANAVTVAKMAANSIDSDQYVDGSIDTAHIADSQITSAKIADGTIATGDIANDAVTSAKLDNSIVMTGSLSAAQVNGGVTTTVVSSSATATTGQNHFISSACTLTLPASPNLGDQVMVAVGNFATAVLGRNSQKIEGTAEDMTIDVARVGLTCVYTGSSYGWAIY